MTNPETEVPDARRVETPARQRVAFSAMRATIGRRMVDSKQRAPHFYVSSEIEMDALLDFQERLNAARDEHDHLTVTALLIRAVALTLERHPVFNAVWHGDVLEVATQMNIAVAVPVGDGLIAPAILNCGHLDVDDVGAALRDLVTRTRVGKLRASELSGGTFTISNMGMFEVSAFAAIIVPPQVAILAIARTEARPVVRDGEVAIRRIMNVTLSADHRAVDGLGAAEFLGDFKAIVGSPDRWDERGTSGSSS